MRGGDDALGVLDRMTCILEAFDQDDRGLGISELSARSGLPKSTVSRLVATLVRQRYLERDGKVIHLGLRLFELGQLAEQPRELRIAALPVMADLRNSLGENVHLAIRDGRAMVCIAMLRGRSGPHSAVRTGARLPLHATALGKVALAFAPPSEVDDILASPLEPIGARTVTDPVVLRAQLADIRRGGIAVEQREFDDDISAAASGVFAAGGELAGVLAVSVRADDFDATRLAPAIRTAARSIAHRLSSVGLAWG